MLRDFYEHGIVKIGRIIFFFFVLVVVDGFSVVIRNLILSQVVQFLF